MTDTPPTTDPPAPDPDPETETGRKPETARLEPNRPTREDRSPGEDRSRRYWHLLAVYLLSTVLGVVSLPFVKGAVPTVVTGALVVVTLFVLMVASLGALYCLVRDSAELRDGDADWSPTWWLYVGASLLAPVVTYEGVASLFGTNAGIVVGAPALVASVFLACAAYLYRRHERVGVP